MYCYHDNSSSAEQLLNELLSFFDYSTDELKDKLPKILKPIKKSWDSKRILKTATRLYNERIKDIALRGMYSEVGNLDDYSDYKDAVFMSAAPLTGKEDTVTHFSVELPLNPYAKTWVGKVKGLSGNGKHKYDIDWVDCTKPFDKKTKHYTIPVSDCPYLFNYFDFELGRIVQVSYLLKADGKISDLPDLDKHFLDLKN